MYPVRGTREKEESAIEDCDLRLQIGWAGPSGVEQKNGGDDGGGGREGWLDTADGCMLVKPPPSQLAATGGNHSSSRNDSLKPSRAERTYNARTERSGRKRVEK